jgi:hypothetical protein
MRRRWLWPTCLCALLTVAGLRGMGIWPTRAKAPPPIPVAASREAPEPELNAAEYRYLHSQPRHWRALMLKH